MEYFSNLVVLLIVPSFERKLFMYIRLELLSWTYRLSAPGDSSGRARGTLKRELAAGQQAVSKIHQSRPWAKRSADSSHR